ncbi:hypothetical protein JANAI62_36670 [Jannaschia pagri]|uniref:Hemin uptake protein hemP n=1 Tax=Jannaschia pagri TaxID=2829797 RepID=A0ABQ4NRL0_9RHOB|nr:MULTISPECIES: hemin uptake protein HemP [unclassified Jannaschia]GIT93189.1 hypothetical protein JANAI61_36470 [Jannaschia sp. AI_61]GIT97044.1 hypothetical protein JANAI62_36670 [Jannaschia sp. AI_62]
MGHLRPPTRDRAPERALTAAAPLTYRADMILQGRDTVQIVLDEKTYTLRLTRAGKLILTK